MRYAASALLHLHKSSSPLVAFTAQGRSTLRLFISATMSVSASIWHIYRGNAL